MGLTITVNTLEEMCALMCDNEIPRTSKRYRRRGRKLMSKSEMREKAKEILQDSIAVAYYKLENESNLTDEEVEQITQYINQYGTAACKAFGREYVTY